LPRVFANKVGRNPQTAKGREIKKKEKKMKWIYNDGGRKEAGYTGHTGDCVVRAFAIVSGIPYQELYDKVIAISFSEHITKKKKRKSNPRKGVYKYTSRKLAKELGFKWIPIMQIGSGCKVHLREEELPKGKIVAKVSRHLVAIVDGVINDIQDPSRGGTRCVYGYYIKETI
jgi:hypothetical protein